MSFESILLISSISMAVSILVLAIYRQLDKNNRSFEKIARLSKSIKEDLSKFAEDKFQSLRDFDNCIDVSIQKGSTLIDGFYKSIDELQNKYNELENEKDKISGFYRKIDMVDKDLAGISDQVREIHESSDFIKNVEDKLSHFKKDMAIVEKNIERIEDELKRENAINLKNVANQIVKETELEIKGVRNEVYGLKKDVESRKIEIYEAAGNSEKDVRSIIERSQKILSDYTAEQEKFFSSNREKLNGELTSITSKVDHLKDNFFNVVIEELNNLNNLNNYKIEQMKNDFARMENEFNSRLEEKIGSFSKLVGELEEKGSTFGKEITDEKNRQLAEVRAVYQNILKEIDRYNEKLRNETKNNLVKSLKDSEEKIRNLNDNFKKTEVSTAARISNYEKLLDESSAKFEELKDRISSELEEKIGAFDKYINNSGEVVLENINKSLNAISGDAFKKTNEITGRFESLYNEVEDKIHVMEKNLADRTKVIETTLVKNQKDVETKLRSEIETRYDDYRKSIHDNIVNNFGDLTRFVENSKSELEGLKSRLAEYIDNSTGEIKNSKDNAINSFNEASAGIDNQILNFEDRINDVLEKQETKIGDLEKDIFTRISSLKDSLLGKIEDINYQYDSKFNEISNKSFDIEKAYDENIDRIYNEGIEKFKGIESKYDSLSENIGTIERKVNGEILSKIDEGTKKLAIEYKNLENDSINTINGYKNDIMKIKQTIKLIDEKYSERLSGKFDDIDRKLIVKMQDVNEIVEKIKEINGKYNDKLAGLGDRIADYENDLRMKSEKIEKDVTDRTNSMLDTRMEKLNDVDEKLSGKLNEIDMKFKELENDILQAKDSYKSLDNNFNNLFAEKLNEVDAKLIDKINEINGKYNYHVNDLGKKLSVIENDFKGKLLEVEEEYKIRGEEAISQKFERLNEFVRQFGDMEKQVDSLRTAIDCELEAKMQSSRKDIDDILRFGREELSRQYKSLEQDTSHNIVRYNEDLEKITQKIKLIDEKFTGRFAKKLGEADEKLVEKLQEMNEKFKVTAVEFNGKLGFFESDFNKKLGEIEQRFIEKGERMILDRSQNLDELKNRFDGISNEINKIKTDLESEISGKIAAGQENIGAMIESGRQKLADEYGKLENETMKNIVDFKNELNRIKQNIQQIDDKFMAKFDRKLNEVDERVNGKINEVDGIYKDNLQELSGRIKNMEYDFEKKLITIEDGYNEKGNSMVNRNIEKVDEIRRLFGDINQEVAQIKDKITSEVAVKIETAKDEINKIYEIGNSRLIENYNGLEEKAKDRIKAYWDELEGIKGGMDDLKAQFNDKIGDKFKALNLNVTEKIKEVNVQYASSVEDLNKRILKVEEEFKDRVRQVESDFNGKEKELFNNSYNELNEFARKFGILNQEINNLKDHLDGDLEQKVVTARENIEKIAENASFKMAENYKSLEDDAEKKILTYRNDLAKVKETIQKIDKYYRENTLERIRKMDVEFESRFGKIDEKWNDKLSQIDGNFAAEMDKLREKIDGMEGDMNKTLTDIGSKALEKTEQTVRANIEKVNDYSKKFGEIENELNVLKARIDGEISEKIENGKKEIGVIISGEAEKIFDEYRLLEARSVDKISEYRNELALLKDNIKHIDDAYNDFISKKIGEMDNQFNVSKFEMDERFKFGINELNDKFRILESEFNGKIIDIELSAKNRNDKLVEENASKLADFGNKFGELNMGITELKENLLSEITEKIGKGKEDLDKILFAGTNKLVEEYKNIEKDSSSQIEVYRNELQKLKKNLDLVDEKYNLRFVKKLEEYDRQFSSKMDSINLVTENVEEIYKNYSGKTDEIRDKVREIEQSFAQRLQQIERQYGEKSEAQFGNSERKIGELTSKFELLNGQISSLQNVINEEVKSIVEKGKTSLVSEYGNLEENTKKKIAEYQSDLVKIKNNIRVIDEKFTGKFIKKINEADEKMLEKINEINERYKNHLSELTSRIKIYENDFAQRVIDLEKNFAEKGNGLLADKTGEINVLNQKINAITEQVKAIGENINFEISQKLEKGKSEINDLYNSGKITLQDEFKKLEDNGLKQIAYIKNDFIKIKENLKQIDEKFSGKFIEKIKNYDDKFISKINEINSHYKDQVEKFTLRFAEMEDNFTKKYENIESLYYEKGEKMISHNFDNLSEYAKKFNELSDNISEIKTKIDDDINKIMESGKTRIAEAMEKGFENFNLQNSKMENDIIEKIKYGKSEIQKVLDFGAEKLSKKVEDLGAELEGRINSYRNDISKMKEEMKLIDQKFIDGYNAKLSETDSKMKSIFAEVNEKYRDHIKGLFEKVKGLEQGFNDRIMAIETDVKSKNTDLYNENRSYFENVTKDFKNVADEIKSMKAKIDGEIQDRINEGKKDIENLYKESNDKLVDQYRTLEGETVRKINDYRTEIFRIKQNIQQLDERFNLAFDDKIKVYDDKLSKTFDEIHRKYEGNFIQLKDKMNLVEFDLNVKANEIAKQAAEKSGQMIMKNDQKLDSFVNKFESLNVEITELKSRIDNEITEKIEQGKIQLNDILQVEIEKTRKSYGEVEFQVEGKLGEYRKEMIKVQNNIKIMDDKYTVKFTDHAAVLDRKILSIEDELKKIERSSMVFDKVNGLKDKLNADIKILKDQIVEIKNERDSVNEIEKKMIGIEEIFRSTNEKCNLILNDKKKIDNIGVIVGELKQVSENVEQKIEVVKSSKIVVANLENKIENVNEKFKLLNDYINEVGDREITIKNSLDSIQVAKGRSDELNLKLDMMNKKLDDLDFKKMTFEKSLKNFEKESALIGKSESKVMEVFEKFSQMNSLIEDLEVRTQSINKIREWLVRAETQIEKMNTESERKIKLLESLINKTGESPLIKERTRDDSSRRDLVLQLQSQGWTVDDIAKTLNLSVGEVEFILDLEVSKRKK
jgi:chromosome segregation ATPase